MRDDIVYNHLCTPESARADRNTCINSLQGEKMDADEKY